MVKKYRKQSRRVEAKTAAQERIRSKSVFREIEGV